MYMAFTTTHFIFEKTVQNKHILQAHGQVFALGNYSCIALISNIHVTARKTPAISTPSVYTQRITHDGCKLWQKRTLGETNTAAL